VIYVTENKNDSKMKEEIMNKINLILNADYNNIQIDDKEKLEASSKLEVSI
jgi:hypothetical protein